MNPSICNKDEPETFAASIIAKEAEVLPYSIVHGNSGW